VHQPPALRSGPHVGLKRWFTSNLDVALVVLAAPIALLLGVPATGYVIGSVAWVLLRLVGAAVELKARAITHWSEQVALRIGYRSLRLVLLAAATVLALGAGGKPSGYTALAVIVMAYTAQLLATMQDSRKSAPTPTC
jgi:hypothetical protein